MYRETMKLHNSFLNEKAETKRLIIAYTQKWTGQANYQVAQLWKDGQEHGRQQLCLCYYPTDKRDGLPDTLTCGFIWSLFRDWTLMCWIVVKILPSWSV